MRGPQVQPGPRNATLDQRAIVAEHPSVAWSASLVQPSEVRVDSQQPIVVAVVGPVARLSGPVEIGLQPREGGSVTWLDASWQDDRGTCVAMFGPGSRIRRGRYDVVARPNAAGMRPVLQAGQLVVF